MKPEIGQKSIFRFRGQKAGFFRCISGNFLQKAEATFHSQKPGFSGFMDTTTQSGSPTGSRLSTVQSVILSAAKNLSAGTRPFATAQGDNL